MTAEQYIRVHLEKQITDNNDDVYASIDGIRECMINFTTGHVKAALEAATEKARINRKPTGEGETSDEESNISFYGDLGYEDYIPVEYTIDTLSIQEAYPLTNIK